MEEHEIDFRVPGLSHSVVKEAEHLRVQELVQRIKNHPHRAALQADLQQNNVYNPFSKNSKEIIRELGNVELSELCETTPKVQCSQCLFYWNQGIVYCSCGESWFTANPVENLTNLDWMHSLSRTTWSRKVLPMVLDTARPKYKDNTIWLGMRGRDAVKKVDTQSEHFTRIHDRFLRDPVYRESQLAIGWSEQKCKKSDELAKEDHTYKLTSEERNRYQGPWYLTLNNGPMRLRHDFRAAVSLKNRLHYESGDQDEEPISPEQYRIWHPSSSTSWWDKSEWNWKWVHKNLFKWSSFCCSWFRLQSIASHCSRRGV